MRLDAFGEVLVLEIDGSLAGVVYREIDADSVAVVKHWRFFIARIGDVEGGHQAVGGGEIIAEEAFNLHIAHLIGLRASIDRTANEHGLPDPGLVELPKVVLCHAVVVALQRRAFFAREIMIQSWLLERATEHHGSVARNLLNGFVVFFLAMIAITVGQRSQQEDSESQNQQKGRQNEKLEI